MRIIFMGTPDFSVPVLQALVAAGHDIAAVYCQPPRPAGRGKKLRASPVQTWAEGAGLAVRHPVNFKDEPDRTAFSELKADVAVVVAYGLILPQAILDAPKLGCLNIHASLLPRWRGAAPIHRAIMAGDTNTGVCIMQMEAGLDTGPVFSCETIPITPQDTTATLHDQLSNLGANLIVKTLRSITDIVAKPQMTNGIIYAHKIEKAEARINWDKPSIEIDRQIRGLFPFPGAWFLHLNQRIKVHKCTVANGVGESSLVLNNNLEVACKVGSLILNRVQKAGKSPQNSSEFLTGTKISKGMKLE